VAASGDRFEAELDHPFGQGQIWADNAASSARQCVRLLGCLPKQLAWVWISAVFERGDLDRRGDTWTEKQVTSASDNPSSKQQGYGRSGCTVRTADGGGRLPFRRAAAGIDRDARQEAALACGSRSRGLL
jgi:hypothetical protein